MTEQLSQAGVRQALFDLHRYLSDQVAPMMVTDAVELLARCPPELVAQEIHGWIDAQFRGPSDGLTVSDCIYHAMKKLHMMTEFELIQKDILESYLEGLAAIVTEFCPEADRQALVDSLSRLGEAEAGAIDSPVAVIHRQGGRDAAATARETGPVSAEVARGVRQLSVFIERLAGVQPGGEGYTPATDGDLVRHALATAAVSSQNETEFQGQLQRLSQVGVDASMEKIFHTLGDGLPGWMLPTQANGDPGASLIPASRSAAAMQKILTMAETLEEGAQRFNDMMQAAIEQFNAGRVVQAATMFDLANCIASEKKLDADVVKNMRGRAHESLAPERLHKLADDEDKREPFKRVLSFFPALTPRGLLASLQNEERRERRKLLLALLEVHGAPARVLALELLDVNVTDGTSDPQGFLQRNLIFLLRRIPSDDKPSDREIDLLVELSALDRPPLLVKESIATLGHVKHARSERALMLRLSELEKTLTETEVASKEATELVGLIDRAVSALAQHRSTNAYRTIVTHALKREPRLGDAMARLDELSDHDLSGDKQLVDRLVKILEQQLPTKVLGFVVGKSSGEVVHLIRGLSGTPSPIVRQAFEEIVTRFPDLEFTEVANQALAGFGATTRSAEAPSKTLTGDVELFGLPNLFQTLADSQVTGVLTLADREGDTAGVLSFEGGRIHGCQVSSICGEAAFYQLFEKPVPGTFTFTSQSSDSLESDTDTEPMEVLPAVLEAMRRHDEFNQARALVPDDLALKPGDEKPQPVPNESDVALMREVWSKASTGVTPETCESLMQIDSYRVRRLYAHWVETRALEPR